MSVQTSRLFWPMNFRISAVEHVETMQMLKSLQESPFNLIFGDEVRQSFLVRASQLLPSRKSVVHVCVNMPRFVNTQKHRPKS